MLTPLLILNYTPNSFSDGGRFKDDHQFSHYLDQQLNKGIKYFDLGVESTAPKNDPITFETEKSRLSEVLKYFDQKDLVLSLDTYRAETMGWAIDNIQVNHWIWNDVSGVLDEATIKLIQENPHVSYVLCHNRIYQKEETSHHMNFITEDDIVSEIIDRWSIQIEQLRKANISLDRIYFDPCFGFAKTFEQNISLFKTLEIIEQKLPIEKWLLGISKKSFLRQIVRDWGSVSEYEDSEHLHLRLISYWNQKLQKPILWRLHNPILKDAVCWDLLDD